MNWKFWKKKKPRKYATKIYSIKPSKLLYSLVDKRDQSEQHSDRYNLWDYINNNLPDINLKDCHNYRMDLRDTLSPKIVVTIKE